VFGFRRGEVGLRLNVEGGIARGRRGPCRPQSAELRFAGAKLTGLRPAPFGCVLAAWADASGASGGSAGNARSLVGRGLKTAGDAAGVWQVSVFGFRRGELGLRLDVEDGIARDAATRANLSPQSSVSLARNLLGFAQPLSVARLRRRATRAARPRGLLATLAPTLARLPIPSNGRSVRRWVQAFGG
jgi:hypothetical protein